MNAHLPTLQSGLDQLGDLIGRVREDDLDAPTPCSRWRVADLVDHTIASVGNLAVATAGGDPDLTAPAPSHADRSAAYARAAEELATAWESAPEDADPRWNTAEIAVHAWDLAQALGVPSSELDDAVAEDALAFMSGALTPERRGDLFGPERQPPQGAGAYERLAAFAGREPLIDPPGLP